MWSWYLFFLVLHVFSVILAFGPSFTYPLIVSLGRRQPEHGAFSVELIEFIERRLAFPMAAGVPLLGVGLIYTGGHDLWRSEWLIISLVVYIAAFSFALFVQLPNTGAMLRLLRSTPVPGAPPDHLPRWRPSAGSSSSGGPSWPQR